MVVDERLCAFLRRAADYDVLVERVGVRVAGSERRVTEPSGKGTREHEDRDGSPASLRPLAIDGACRWRALHRSNHISVGALSRGSVRVTVVRVAGAPRWNAPARLVAQRAGGQRRGDRDG
jgi:hypothetical protein